MPDAMRAGFPVHWRRFGSGPDHAVLLHCALAHSGAWSGVAERLGDRLSMIAPDMPGHGRSGSWDQRGDLHDQVTAIARDCLGRGGHVIGHSFGATVALRLAIEDRARVHSVTLIEPVLFAAAGQSRPDILADYLAAAGPFSNALRQGDWADAAAHFLDIWGDGRDWTTLGDRERDLIASQMRVIRETDPCLTQDTAGLLQTGRLEAIACPVLLIRGDRSEPVIRAIHETLLRRIPNAAESVLAGAGHMGPITHPAKVATLIRDHLDRA